MKGFLLAIVALTLLQNLVLSTGIGSSLLVRVTRRPRDILTYGCVLCGFLVLSVLVTYPIDRLLGTEPLAKFWRPAVMIVAVALLYLIVSPLLQRIAPKLYKRIAYLIPLAAFNNIVIGLLLIINHQFSATIYGALGVALGAAIGFVLLSWLVAEAIERMNHPDAPSAFRGLPSILLYLGILALAISGFTTDIAPI